jgi:hypothetical protein
LVWPPKPYREVVLEYATRLRTGQFESELRRRSEIKPPALGTIGFEKDSYVSEGSMASLRVPAR